MRNKHKSSNTFPSLLPSSGSTSLVVFFTSSATEAHCLCCSFCLRGRISHSFTLLQCGVPFTAGSPLWTSPIWALPRPAPGVAGELCSNAWGTSSPSFCTDPYVCRIVSLCVLHPYSWMLYQRPVSWFSARILDPFFNWKCSAQVHG